MGANCCVAARNKPLSHSISCEDSNNRNVRHSPSWSFRWDNRTHVEDIMENSSWHSQQNSGNIGSESKSAADTETDCLSDGGSPSEIHQTPKWRKRGELSGSSKSILSDQSTRSNSPLKGMGSVKSTATAAAASDMKPSSSIRRSLHPEASSSSRKARWSPGYPLSRQISDSRITSLKSLHKSSSSCSSPEGRQQSFVLSSVCSSNDLSAAASSSDGWSMQAFSELVAASSSHRERLSVDSGTPSSLNSNKIARSPPRSALQTCGVCSKSLRDKSPWSGQKIVVSTNELSVAAVLICGHIYHAECLESVTSETDRFDPPCPVCTAGVRSKLAALKLLGKAEQKAKSKISRRAVADMDLDGDSLPYHWSMGASSSMKGSLGIPFVRRHFSTTSCPPPVRSASESESTRKAKGFWARYRR